jgi:hypothetical protein
MLGKVMIFFKQRLFLVFILIVCSSAWAQSFKISFPTQEIRLDTMVTLKTATPNQQYDIYIHIGNEDSNSLIIHPKESLDTINIIYLSPNRQWGIPETYKLFEFIDINLDGYSDLFVLFGIDWRYWGTSYDIWLFDVDNKKFEYSDEFTDKIYSDYKLDKRNKIISTNWYGWNDHNEYGTDTYKINGKNLIHIERVSQKYADENKYIWKKEKYINGKMEVVEQKFKNENDEEINKEE